MNTNDESTRTVGVTEADISAKVDKVLKGKLLFKRAIKARICPECGEPIQRFIGEF